jgi:hypothetical protein
MMKNLNILVLLEIIPKEKMIGKKIGFDFL